MAAKATTSAAVLLLLAAVVTTVQVATAATDDGTTHLSFFMHDIVTGKNPTAVQVIKGPGSTTAPALGMSFGDTTVIDDALTETSSPTSTELGRMQGFYMLSSQSGAVLMVCANLVLTSGPHNGSTLAVLGRDDTSEAVRELSVVGGTGTLRMATGYVLWNTSSMSGADATVQLSVFVTTGGNASTIDAAAPVSPVDGGGGGSSGDGGSGSGTTKASSGGVRRRTAGGWGNVSCVVVAVVVAVVGSCWVW